MQSKEVMECMLKILEEKKGMDIQVLPVEDRTTLADYFVVVSGSSTPHVKSLAEEVEFVLKTQHQLLPRHLEGQDSARWILLDYGDVVLHVFHKEERAFYRLEDLWREAPKTEMGTNS